MLMHIPAQISRFKAEIEDVDLKFDVDETAYSYDLVSISSWFLSKFDFNADVPLYVSSDLSKLKGVTGRIIVRLNERKERLNKNIEYERKKIAEIIS